MLLFLSILGIILTSILIYNNVKAYTASVYLGIFFFLVSLYTLNQCILHSSKSVLLVTIFLTHFNFLFYLIGPSFYWYFRSVLTDNPRLARVDLLHLLPMTLYFVASLPYFFSPYAYKVQVAQAVVRDFDFLWSFNPTILSELFSRSVVYLSLHFQILGYTCWSIVLMIRYNMQRKETSVLPGQKFMFRWLVILSGLQFILVTSRSLLMIRTFYVDPQVFHTLNTLQIISLTGLTGLILSPVFFPEILYGLPRLNFTPETGLNPGDLLTETGMNHRMSLSADYLRTIGERADSCMQEQSPYLDADFNLTRFSVMIDVPIHHLSYYFREVKKESFTDWRNQWRIDYAKKLIRDGNMSKHTLETIGIQSGFLTRNTFLKVFKKKEGISPKDYASQIKNQLY